MKSISSTVVGVAAVFNQPVFVGLIASSLCALGLSFLIKDSKRIPVREGAGESNAKGGVGISSSSKETLLYCTLSAAAVTIVVLVWTKSVIITTPFSFFAIIITWAYLRNKGRREAAAMSQVWPEVTDHLISAIHSGLSLSEALVGLARRGPELVRPHFLWVCPSR